MSPFLMARFRWAYSAIGLCSGTAKVRFRWPEEAPPEHQRVMTAVVNHTTIKGMSSLVLNQPLSSRTKESK